MYRLALPSGNRFFACFADLTLGFSSNTWPKLLHSSASSSSHCVGLLLNFSAFSGKHIHLYSYNGFLSPNQISPQILKSKCSLNRHLKPNGSKRSTHYTSNQQQSSSSQLMAAPIFPASQAQARSANPLNAHHPNRSRTWSSYPTPSLPPQSRAHQIMITMSQEVSMSLPLSLRITGQPG